MKLRTGIVVVVVLVAVGVIAGVALAQLTDSQTASGTITATSTSADLYICEPDSTPGPACGSDHSGADETVFETLEDIRPGETVTWDVRLKNVGTDDWVLANAVLTVVETADPGGDCPDNVLWSGRNLNDQWTNAGAFILGKAGDSSNDNPVPGSSFYLYQWSPYAAGRAVKVAAGDYEDIRLSLQLTTSNTENCDGNEWSVSWTFTAG